MVRRKKTRRPLRSNPRGVLRVRADGYGFVHTAEGEFFVPATKMGGAFDGDLVELLPITVNKGHKQFEKVHAKTGERPTARIIQVLDRAYETLIGRYEIAEPFGVVVPEDRRIPYDIFTMRADHPDVNDGDIVRVKITTFPSKNTAATGVIEEVIGHDGDQAFAVDMIIARHKLETEFSESSIVQSMRAEVAEESALVEGYRDLRERTVFTIDPVDARDFDDAVSLEREEGMWRLGVHIADVAHYVEWGSSVDLDARRRATSVYLVDRVIPMLPEALSNEVCSLKPGEARRTMTVDMYLDSAFQVRKFEIYPSLIRSAKRFGYDEVQRILDSDDDTIPFTDTLSDFCHLAKQLMERREREGSIEFISTEAKVHLDAEGKPQEVVLRRKTDATTIVEECMILANTVVARFLHEKAFPCIYRVHEPPASDNLAELIPILQEFGRFKDLPASRFAAGNPFVIQEVLEKSKGRPEEELISSLILRAMKRALYQAQPSEHYGLARPLYCHFTSPIRRYPDLVVHRMLHALIEGKPATFEEQTNSLDWLAEHSSKMERIAEAAARESQEVKLAEYHERDIGARFEAVIAAVANYGFFVRLPTTAEGLVPVRSLGNEYFSYDPQRHILTGEDTGITYRLGQKVSVILEAVDVRLGQLDFRIVKAD